MPEPFVILRTVDNQRMGVRESAVLALEPTGTPSIVGGVPPNTVVHLSNGGQIVVDGTVERTDAHLMGLAGTGS